MSVSFPLLGLIVLAVGGFLAFKLLQGLFWVLRKAFLGLGLAVGHVLRFVRNELVDGVHLAGAVLTAVAILPLAVVNLFIGRWAAARHYGRAVEDEATSALLGLYRIVLGHPLRLVFLGPLLDGFERRRPDVVERAPGAMPRGAKGARFAGYDIYGSLPPGGSGAQLFLARPTEAKRAELREAGHAVPDSVVIKYFGIEAGSTLPQIVRENQALRAASRLGLVLEHELSNDRFFYVMTYVAGEELDKVIHRLHAHAGPLGLNDQELLLVGAYACDLLATLDRFHGEGLWHKDVKPSNLIVADGHVHLVDIGLVTPLAADITLTTHGTEYYRDPDMVRLALQGVKVHEVDGAKFDIYSAGAVIYSMLENSFPAHGSLSRISKRCPEALAWIVRRSMTDMHARYASAREMLRDLTALATAPDPFAVRPADLPSFGREGLAASDLAHAEPLPPLRRPAAGPSLASFRKEQPITDPDMRRHRRRRGLRLLAAVLVFAFGARAWSEWRQDERRAAYAYDAFAFERLPRADRTTLLAATSLLEDPAFEELLAELDPVRSAHAGRPATLSMVGASPTAPASGQVLLLEDLPGSSDREFLERLERSLERNGLEILGTPDGAGDARVIRLLAEARNAVGLRGLDDREAVLALQDFLDASDEVDAVLWLGAGEGEGKLDCQLLVRRDLKVAPARTLRVETRGI